MAIPLKYSVSPSTFFSGSVVVLSIIRWSLYASGRLSIMISKAAATHALYLGRIFNRGGESATHQYDMYQHVLAPKSCAVCLANAPTDCSPNSPTNSIPGLLEKHTLPRLLVETRWGHVRATQGVR